MANELSLPDEIEKLEVKLSEFYTPEEIDLWLNTPQPLLRYRRPSQIIVEDGVRGVEALNHLIDWLQEAPYL